MYDYNIKSEEVDMIVNKVSKYLKSLDKDFTEFQKIGLDICERYQTKGINLSHKQKNIIGRIYYSCVYEYKKPTKKMINDAREKASIELAKQELKNEKYKKELLDLVNKRNDNSSSCDDVEGIF